MDREFGIRFGAICAILCALGVSHKAICQTGLPDGKGKAEFVHNCTACHRADMVTRVKKTPEDWRKSVDDMAARGTDGSKEDLDNAYLYLVKNFSKDKSDSVSATHPDAAAESSPKSETFNFFDIERFQRSSGENIFLLNNRDPQRLRPVSTLNSVKTRDAKHRLPVGRLVRFQPTRVTTSRHTSS
jgi:hypothetical protein